MNQRFPLEYLFYFILKIGMRSLVPIVLIFLYDGSSTFSYFNFDITRDKDMELEDNTKYYTNKYEYLIDIPDNDLPRKLLSENLLVKNRALESICEKYIAGILVQDTTRIILKSLQGHKNKYVAAKANIALILTSQYLSEEKAKMIIRYLMNIKIHTVKIFGITYLGKLGDKTAIPYLNSQSTVKEYGFGEPEDESIGLNVAKATNLALDEIHTKGYAPKEKAKYLVKQLLKSAGRSRNIPRREMLIYLGNDATPVLVHELIKLMNRDLFKGYHKDSTKRIPYTDPGIEISHILYKIDNTNKKAASQLKPYLKHPHRLVRYWAVQTLSGVGDRSVINELEAFKKSKNDEVGTIQSADEAIQRIRARAVSGNK